MPTLGAIDAYIATHKNEFTPERSKAIDALLQGMQEAVETAKTVGVKLITGFDADSGELQGKNAAELTAMTKRGLTSLEVIQAATINAAELLSSQDSLGVIEAGHYADVIAVDGDPIADITILQHVTFVMKGGKIVKNETTR